jgi:hypothetical protein
MHFCTLLFLGGASYHPFVVGRSALLSMILYDHHQQSQFIGASIIAISPSSQEQQDRHNHMDCKPCNYDPATLDRHAGRVGSNNRPDVCVVVERCFFAVAYLAVCHLSCACYRLQAVTDNDGNCAVLVSAASRRK